ncbi:MAG: proline--tRNA ligase [Spirochaetaceae bacterium]
MRYSRLLAHTLRTSPHGVRSVSYQLLVRGGFIRSLGTGLFSFLPLGNRVLRNIKRIISSEMEALGGQEVMAPLVNPRELWERTGRTEALQQDLVRFRDRTGKALVLAPTHEEAMVELVRNCLNSYRNLPMLVYQYQVKFRDEEKVRCGLMRTKEFVMKDGYSFHRTFADLNNFFPRMFQAYLRIFNRCNVSVIPAEAGVGYMGGDRSFEFLMESQCGDDMLTICDNCGYHANADVAVGRREIRQQAPLPLERTETPDCRTMRRLSRYLERPLSELAKPMIYRTGSSLVMVVVRADHEVSTEKLQRVLGEPVKGLASLEAVEDLGLIPGYLSPIGIEGLDARVVVDEVAADSPNLVYGANEPGYHFLNGNFGRDYDADLVADVARIPEGSMCVHCGHELSQRRSTELGHIFRLGDFYSRSMDLFFRGERSEKVYPYMGSYGIGLGRLIAGVVEQNHDEKGIIWPSELAPYTGFLMAIGRSPTVRRITENLYDELGNLVLFDDRHESIGTKLKDADLIGLPLRIVVSNQTIQDGAVEITLRRGGEERRIPLDQLPAVLEELRKEATYDAL